MELPALWLVICILSAFALIFSVISLVITILSARKSIDTTQLSKRISSVQEELADAVDKFSGWKRRDAVRRFRNAAEAEDNSQEPLPLATPESTALPSKDALRKRMLQVI